MWALVLVVLLGAEPIDQCAPPAAVGRYDPSTPVARVANATCVRVVWHEGAVERQVSVRVDQTLPTPPACAPPRVDSVGRAFDFRHAGMCGRGLSGRGWTRDCLIHDACVWANCAEPDLVGGGLPFVPWGPSYDPRCGAAFARAMDDWLDVHLLGCGLACPAGTTCAWTLTGRACRPDA